MERKKPKTKDNELHWFWRYTSSWWGIPSFYLILSFLAYFISYFILYYGNSAFSFSEFIFAPMFLPMGLVIFVELITGGYFDIFYDTTSFLIGAIFGIIFTVIYSIIIYQRYKNNKIMKKLIILLLILILLSFSGCIVDIWTGTLDIYID